MTRLRRQRQRSRLPLDDIARDTRVKVEFLEALERNELSRWPKGLYARAWVRSYANAVGLDADETVDEFCRLFPQGDRRTHQTIEEMGSILGHEVQAGNDVPAELERRADARRVYQLQKPTWSETLVRAARAGWNRVVGVRPAAELHVKDRPGTTGG